MNTYLCIKHTVLVSLMVLGLWLLPGLTVAADLPSGQAIPSGSNKETWKNRRRQCQGHIENLPG